MDTQDNRIPVTLLAGFLGAGKTTLLNKLIQDPSAGRIAVIMNEFGDVGLDHDLIENVRNDVVLMHSGCLCCSIRGDLAKTMILLLSQLKRGELFFDRLVIETTGIADPAPIVNTMVTDALIADNYRLDGVVVLADAATGLQTLDKHFEVVSQIAMADLIVVTKSDLVTPRACEQFESRLSTINGSARCLRAEFGNVPIESLFGLSAMTPDATSDKIAGWLGAGGNSATDDDHNHSIASASIEVTDPIQADVFDFWLDTLISLKGPDVLRVKGIAHVEDIEYPFVFHGVQHIFDAPVPL
ncbi:MAG: GTP-binding protein, partial [Pseudomonadota bacterium]